MCAQVTNPDNPDQGNDRHGHHENRQHDANDGGLLGAVFSVDGSTPRDEEHIEQGDNGKADHDVEQLVGKQGVLQDQIANRTNASEPSSR